VKANDSPYKGMTMQRMIQARQEHITPSNNGVASLNPAESARNYRITARLNSKNFMGMIIQRVVLPHDTKPGMTDDQQAAAIKQAQDARQQEFYRQASMPWGSVFMVTPTDKQRLNNPAMASALKQKQLAPPSTYGQFYAFMHAVSAAFGNGG
jgi:hypothetical protein